MKNKIIGKIKNIKYNPENGDLEALIIFLDEKFKKKLLRDLSLSGDITFDGKNVIFKDENDNAKI